MGKTLPDLPGTGGFGSGSKFSTRDYIAAYLREHGPSTVKKIAGDEYGPPNISTCLRTHSSLFERCGVSGNQRATVWQLKKGSKR
jgi:hypothetical protein